MKPFHIDEFIGHILALEFDNGDVVTGAFAGSYNNYIVLRDSQGEPLLFQEKFVRAIFIAPEPTEETNDNAE